MFIGLHFYKIFLVGLVLNNLEEELTALLDCHIFLIE